MLSKFKAKTGTLMTDMCPVAGHCSTQLFLKWLGWAQRFHLAVKGLGSIPSTPPNGGRQAIRACSAISLMAIRLGGRMRKSFKKGGRRLGYTMTERNEW